MHRSKSLPRKACAFANLAGFLVLDLSLALPAFNLLAGGSLAVANAGLACPQRTDPN